MNSLEQRPSEFPNTKTRQKQSRATRPDRVVAMAIIQHRRAQHYIHAIPAYYQRLRPSDALFSPSPSYLSPHVTSSAV
nr:MAG TPA: hypothetical protein [Caudoviricetes sp.]